MSNETPNTTPPPYPLDEQLADLKARAAKGDTEAQLKLFTKQFEAIYPRRVNPPKPQPQQPQPPRKSPVKRDPFLPDANPAQAPTPDNPPRIGPDGRPTQQQGGPHP
jgi:hypothetical protein